MKNFLLEIFLEKLNEKNKFQYILGDYENRESRLWFKCLRCGCKLPLVARRALNKECPNCTGSRRRITTEIYKEDVYKEVGDEYSVLGEYIDGSTKIKIRHNKCMHVWDIIPKNFIRANRPTRCPDCSKLNITNFNEKIKNITNINDFEMVKPFQTGDTTIILKCKQCTHSFKRSVSYLTKKGTILIKCPNCSGSNTSIGTQIIKNFLIENSIEYSLEVYFNKFKSTNGNKFKYDFFLKQYNLIIEFDGLQHFQSSNRRFSPNNRFRDLLKDFKIKNSKVYKLLRISYKEILYINEILQDVLFGEGSTTILKYNLLYITANSSYNEDTYYTNRSTLKQVETGGMLNYYLEHEDIVSTFNGS